MRIGIDAKDFFNDNNPSGKTVVENLIGELLKIDNQNIYYVFLDKKYKNNKFPYVSSNVKLVYIWSSLKAISNIFVLPIFSWKYKLDILLLQYFTPFYLNCKKIVYIHDCIFKSHPQYFSFLERLYYYPILPLSRFADLIITISNSEKKRLIKYSSLKDASKIIVIYNGISKDFKPLNRMEESLIHLTKVKFNLPTEFILYVGRLNHRKNIQNLIKAVGYLNNQKIKLVLVGKYNRKVFDLPTIIDELGLHDRMIFLDYVEDSYLPIIYSLATVFCYLSFQEGFGLPPLEAMAAGIPVLVSESSSLPEICGEAGTYANPLNPVDIATKIDLLLSDPIIYKKKRQLGFKQASLYSWAESSIKLISLFNSFVQNQ